MGRVTEIEGFASLLDPYPPAVVLDFEEFKDGNSLNFFFFNLDFFVKKIIYLF